MKRITASITYNEDQPPGPRWTTAQIAQAIRDIVPVMTVELKDEQFIFEWECVAPININEPSEYLVVFAPSAEAALERYAYLTGEVAIPLTHIVTNGYARTPAMAANEHEFAIMEGQSADSGSFMSFVRLKAGSGDLIR